MIGRVPLELPHTPLEGHTSDARIAAIAARQHAVITIWQLYALGLDTSAVAKRVARGALYRRHRGVYVVGQPNLSPEGECLAAVLAAGPGAALSHRPAGRLHGISRFHPPCIAVVTTTKRRPKGVEVHRVRALDPRDVTTHNGVPVTTVHRTLVDLADELTPHQLANVIHEAAYRGRFVEAAVRDSMNRVFGRRKLGVLERAIELHHAGSAGTKSAGEDAFLTLGYPEPLVTTDLHGYEVDFHWPEHRLVVEIDGGGHSSKHDAGRDHTLQAAGYSVLRLAS
jgi:hypothetical protein